MEVLKVDHSNHTISLMNKIERLLCNQCMLPSPKFNEHNQATWLQGVLCGFKIDYVQTKSNSIFVVRGGQLLQYCKILR
jgi:hypothetical protein